MNATHARNDTPPRTQYAIRLTHAQLYLSASGHWTTDKLKARHFEFMTIANAHAMLEHDMSCDEFTIEPVQLDPHTAHNLFIVAFVVGFWFGVGTTTATWIIATFVQERRRRK